MPNIRILDKYFTRVLIIIKKDKICDFKVTCIILLLLQLVVILIINNDKLAARPICWCPIFCNYHRKCSGKRFVYVTSAVIYFKG